MGNILIARFFNRIPQEYIFKIEYVTFFVAITVFAGFVKSMFPQEVSNKVWIRIKGITLLGIILVTITSTSFFSRILIAFQVFVFLLFIYILLAVLKAVIREKTGAAVIALSGIAFITSAVNDMLYPSSVMKVVGRYLSRKMDFVFKKCF